MSVHTQEKDAEQLRTQIADAKKVEDVSVVPVWAGSSVGLIKSIEPAEKLVTEFAAATAHALKRTASELVAA